MKSRFVLPAILNRKVKTMSIVQPYSGRYSRISRTGSGSFFRPLAGVARFAVRIAASWRQRSDLMLIQSLPDDLRKDIGWRDGGSNL